MDEINRGIFVIGNGADLFCGLESSINDFYKHFKNSSKYKDFLLYVSRNKRFKHAGYLVQDFPIDAAPSLDEDFSLIEVMLLLLDPMGNLRYWNEVESILQKSLIGENNFNWGYVLKHIKNCYSTYLNKSISNRRSKHPEINYNEMVAAAMIVHHLDDFNDINENIFYELLNNELTKFESKFRSYLLGQVKQNKEYSNKVDELVKEFTNFGVDFKYTKIISFNYTKPICHFNGADLCNIHGNLTDKCIIGIDINQNYPQIDIFTKTFRKWTQCKGINTDYNYKYVKNVYFFGHSFNEQDYSLYFSLFDRIGAFDNIPKINMTLFYSKGLNDNRNPEEIKNNLLINLLKMIKEYCIRRDSLILFDNIVNKGISVKYIDPTTTKII